MTEFKVQMKRVPSISGQRMKPEKQTLGRLNENTNKKIEIATHENF